VVSFTTQPLYPRGKSPRHPLDRRLGEPHSRSHHGSEEKKSLPLPSPLPCHYTDTAIPAHPTLIHGLNTFAQCTQFPQSISWQYCGTTCSSFRTAPASDVTTDICRISSASGRHFSILSLFFLTNYYWAALICCRCYYHQSSTSSSSWLPAAHSPLPYIITFSH